MGRTLFAALAGIALFILPLAPANAGKFGRGGPPRRFGKKVWSGLVVATNAAKPRPAPVELHRLDRTLQHTFGYNQFEVIGQSQRALQSGEANWLAVSKHFSLHVDPRGVSSDGYRVHLQLFQDRQVLLETDATLSRSSPLVIKGPQIGAGQLLLLLVVQ
ncbi:MAG: hypothetical protein ACREIF_11360 [Chthoniobacterales bacterium]